jgi:hyperosmotically inducible periplasmic protein
MRYGIAWLLGVPVSVLGDLVLDHSPLERNSTMKKQILASTVACAGILLVAVSGWSQTTPSAPDNSRMNASDRAAGAPTADQQSNSKSDTELTRQIRRAVTKDTSLSVSAHNVKIISSDGSVTLKGPVKNDAEKASIAAKAEAIAGAGKVNNQLEVENQ